MNALKNTPQWIIEDFNKSGLDLASLPVESLKGEGELMQRLGFSSISGTPIISIGGYWIKYPNVPDYSRLKLKHPIETDNGKVKYLSPKKEMGFGNHAYILPEVEKICRPYNPNKHLYLTEGEKKAAKATIEGFPCIGLPGVSIFKDNEDDLLPELEKCVWKNRHVYIVFDSDITDKLEVRRAELRLAIELSNRGAKVFAIRLPSEVNGDKNGLDDYLVRYSAEEFRELTKESKPTIDLQVSEGADKDLILEELPRLDNNIDTERVLNALADREGVKRDTVRAEYRKQIPQKEESEATPKETFTAEHLRQAEDLLSSPYILSSVLAITKQLGFTGEEINQKLLYLSFTSRLMDDSISVIVKGQSASGKSHLTNTVLRLFPQSEVLSFSFVTSKALVYRQGDMSHKILYIAEHSGSEAANYSIRTMLSEGEISIMSTVMNEATNKHEAMEKRIPAKGLVFVETTTRDRIHAENQTRVFDLYVDESERQTTNILTMQATQMKTASPEVSNEIKVWRASQSLLKQFSVYVPYAPDLAQAFPTGKTRARRDFPRLLSLIRAHALLNQYQRKTSQDGRLIATLEDLSGVLSIIERVLEDTQRALSPKQAEVLNIIQSEEVMTEFSIGDVSEVVKVDRKTLRRYLKQFTSEGLVEWNGERGKKSCYTKVSNPQSLMSPIGSFLSKIRELLEKNQDYSGLSQMTPKVPNTPNFADKGQWDDKGHTPMSPIKTNDKEQKREKKGVRDIGTEEHGGNIPSKDNKEAELSNSEDWEAEKQRFLGESKKDVEL